MDIAVFSDIHSNYVAFQRCLDEALERGIETFIFLGDYLGDLAYPQRTMDILYTLKERYQCYFIKGNKEDYWIYHESNSDWHWKSGSSSSGALYYTYENITSEDLAFFEGLNVTETIRIDGMEPITACHGSLHKNNEKMIPEDERTIQMVSECESNLILCGHTHVRNMFSVGEKKVVNPGSVGAPIHSGGRAQFMILHAKQDKWEPEFIQLSYDKEKVLRDLKESGLIKIAPYWSLISSYLIMDGEIDHGNVLAEAARLCRMETGAVNWRDIPEIYWKKAVEAAVSKVVEKTCILWTPKEFCLPVTV